MKSQRFSRKQRVQTKKILPPIETINDLLAKDDVSAVLQEVNSKKSTIQSIIIIYTTDDGFVNYRTSESDEVTNLGIIEFTKNLIFNGDEE